ncbi:MAG TPA: hypothetical protein PLW20_08360, partial [Paludibacteraceae bacterium]|nr:hypothetical protein [Paludibacteraceae bacterium]
RLRLVDDNYKLAQRDICEGRKFTTSYFDKLVDSSFIFLPDDAISLKLADTLARWSDIAEVINKYEMKNRINVALLQILSGDYNSARKTLSAIQSPNATTAYLSAIIGARTNDRETVYSNLKLAISKDKSMAAKALNDIEFAKFATDQTFLSIVQ